MYKNNEFLIGCDEKVKEQPKKVKGYIVSCNEKMEEYPKKVSEASLTPSKHNLWTYHNLSKELKNKGGNK